MPNALSRPDIIREGSTAIATYRYLGLGSFVGVDYPVPVVALTYQHGSSGEAGDQYTGLDRFGRVIDLRWNKASTALVSSTYGYNQNSNQTWRKDAAAVAASVNTEDQMFWYDGLQQVTDRQRGSLVGSPPYSGISSLQQNEQFTFDETGNWLTDYNSTAGPLSQSRTHNQANEITSLAGPTGVVQPVYDAVGNCTFAPKPDVWQEGYYITFDAWNRMVDIMNAGVSYRYDALFRRIVAHPGTDDDYYYTDQWQVSEVYRGSTLQWRAFWGIRDLNDIIKRDGATAFGTDRYGLRDKLNIVAVTDGSGAVDLRIAYDTFGKARYLDSDWDPAINSKLWNFVFHGYQLDFETGFLAVRFRMYHPTLGRWLSRDPLQYILEFNYYCAFNNNPNTFSDFNGMEPELLGNEPTHIKELPQDDWKKTMIRQQGCVGITRAVQGYQRNTNDAGQPFNPEEAPGVKCFATEAEAKNFKCENKKKHPVIFAVQGTKRANLPLNEPKKPVPNNSIITNDPSIRFNYCTLINKKYYWTERAWATIKRDKVVSQGYPPPLETIYCVDCACPGAK